jgi:hypothetical protein
VNVNAIITLFPDENVLMNIKRGAEAAFIQFGWSY